MPDCMPLTSSEVAPCGQTLLAAISALHSDCGRGPRHGMTKFRRRGAPAVQLRGRRGAPRTAATTSDLGEARAAPLRGALLPLRRRGWATGGEGCDAAAEADGDTTSSGAGRAKQRPTGASGSAANTVVPGLLRVEPDPGVVLHSPCGVSSRDGINFRSIIAAMRDAAPCALLRRRGGVSKSACSATG